ncbi:MAG: hypothetical protein ABW128_02235 [Rhizorhabdus sp.]
MKSWTIHQLAGAGSLAGIAALMLWPAFVAWPEALRLPFVLILAAACFCGAAMLWITLRDIARRPVRGSRLRPIRTFDVLLGLALTVPTTLELSAILPDGLMQFGLL